MFKYFWAFETDLPQGIGTPNFGTTHLNWIAASILLIISVILVYRRQNVIVQKRIQIILVILVACLDISRWIWAAIIGHYSIQVMLPLHLCSLAIWIEMAAVFTGKPLFKELGYALGMPGALASILTPDWGVYPFISYQYLQAALGHTLLVMIPAIWIWGDGFRPDIRRLPKCFGLLVLVAIPIAFVNWLLGSNYMFLCYAPKDTPLELFEKWCGNPGYLVPLVLLILVVWLILYLPWVIKARWQKQAHAKGISRKS